MTNHLKEINCSYINRLRLAILNSVKLAASSVVLLIHAVIPCLFTTTTSNLLQSVVNSFPKKHKHRILVRFNTKWRNDTKYRQWRVLVDGIENLASKVHIKIPCETVEENVSGEQKFHFVCYGDVLWNNNEATIQ